MTALELPEFAAYRGQPVLVTGGAGFIGSHLAAALLRHGASVRVLDDLSGGKAENIPPGADFIRGSILEDSTLARAAQGVRFIFHHAAEVSVPRSVEDPEKCIRTNVEGTMRVLETARRDGMADRAGRIVFAASAAAYGDSPLLPSCEDDAPDAVSPYAMSKVSGELLMRSYARCYGLSTVSLRYFNIFGPRQNPDSPYAAAITAFLKAMRAGDRPKVHGDGLQTRDFTYIDNVVLANLLAGTTENPLAGEVVNIGTGVQTSLLEVIGELGRAMGLEPEPRFTDPRPGDVRDSVADISLARELLGYEPVVDLAEGLRRTVTAA